MLWVYVAFVLMIVRPCHSFPGKITTFRNQKSELFDNSDNSISSVDQRNNERDNITTTPRLCVILPSYNEQYRIERTLNDYTSYLRQTMKTQLSHVDIIIVNDGSTDQTERVVNDYIFKKGNKIDDFFDIHLCHVTKNVGKGAAISRGIDFVSQQTTNRNNDESIIILIADADGSGDIQCLPNFISELRSLILRHGIDDLKKFWNNPALVVGRRVEANKTPSRFITRWGFRTAVQLFSGINNNIDTQCGFKLMTLSTARKLYQDLQLQRWSHDVEVVYRAQRIYNYPITSCPVNWSDRPGSKLVTETNDTQQYLRQIIQVSTVMLLDIIQMRWQYSMTNHPKK